MFTTSQYSASIRSPNLTFNVSTVSSLPGVLQCNFLTFPMQAPRRRQASTPYLTIRRIRDCTPFKANIFSISIRSNTRGGSQGAIIHAKDVNGSCDKVNVNSTADFKWSDGQHADGLSVRLIVGRRHSSVQLGRMNCARCWKLEGELENQQTQPPQ